MILVTGAAGLVGWPVARRLTAEGHEVLATDARTPEIPLACHFVQADLRQAGVIAQLLHDHPVRRVVHAGAISGSLVAPDDPLLVMSVNVTGTLYLAEACRLAGVERLVALSSIGVYGDQIGVDPVCEEAPQNGSDIYSRSKIAMENILAGYRDNFGLNVTMLRLSSIFGPGRRTPCFIRGLLEAALDARPAVVSDDTAHRRQFIYIDDAVQAVRLALEAPEGVPTAFNATGGTWLSEADVASQVKAAVPSLQVETAAIAPLGLDGRMGPLDMGRAVHVLGYAPQVSLAEGARLYAAHLAQLRG